ncbi:OmpA family protein [uncultured Thiodictyon sp.]|uniref:OmpA family protein n=1 Tax=uncultured Thiodictyon sp. TaxID=1846217 RepID=UPI0025E2D952|nr:OmpA family protein [uncultured Thiodictyon sp.]
MSESRPSLYPRFTWILLAVLIGVGALGQWYIRSLHQQLAARDARINETTQQLDDTKRWLKTSTDSEQGLRAQLAAAQTQLQSTTELHGAAAAAAAQYQQDLAAAAAREQELTGRVAAADERLTKAIAEANTKWAEKLRIYQLGMNGTEPQRAALITRLEQQASAAQTVLDRANEQCRSEREQAEQARQGAETQLTAQLAQTQHQVDEDAQALAADASAKLAQEGLLAEANGKVLALTEELQAGRGALAEQQQKYEQALATMRIELDQAAQTLAGVQTELSAAVATATQAKQAQEQQLQTAEQRIATLEQDLKASAARSEEDLAAAKRALEEARVETQQTLEQVRAEAEQSKQALAADCAAKTAAAKPPLSTRYPGLKAQQTERGTLIRLGEDQLHFRAAVLPKGKNPSLDRLAALLGEQPNLTVRIEGYTDSAGEDDANLTLSKARADTVRQALIDRGVASERLSAEGFGKQRPIADNATPADRRKNRRIEVYLIEPAL